MLRYRSAQLANGLRIVTVEQPHLHTVCATVLVRCGARHDPAAAPGLAHFLEHMLFRGSERFPSSRSLSQAFEAAGGSLQAATWRDHSSYSATLHPSYLESVLAALADMVGFPTFAGLDLERGIVEEELRAELNEDGADVDLTNVSRAAVWRDHPMGRRITGTMAALPSVSTAALRAHHRRYYGASNMVLCVAGRVTGDAVQNWASEYFARLPAGRPAEDGPAPLFNPPCAVATQPYEGSQVGLQLTFPALADGHRDFAALMLLASILDDGTTSRLRHALCEERGLIYELDSGLDCYADCGLYDIAMQVAPQHATEAVAVTLNALAQLCETGISENELSVARQRHLHGLEFRVDSTDELSQHLGIDTLFKRYRTREDESGQFHAVRVTDIQRVANQLFRSGKMHASVLGPLARARIPAIEKQVVAFAKPRK